MILKKSLVNDALVKLGMGQSESLTGYSGTSFADVLAALEEMMAQYKGIGWDINYQFATPWDSGDDVTPSGNQDSMIDLVWKSAVTSNLAVRIAPYFEVTPSAAVQAEAQNGELQMMAYFTRTPDKKPAMGIGIIGSGNLVKKGFYF